GGVPAGSYALTGPIVNVADGDTVTLRAPVEAGYAWAYTARRGDYLRDPAMPGLQRQAREAGRGLWAQSGAIEPWKWRYDCWRQRRC
ncbi:thermonuclease family protein, partial [Bordetella pertussis]|uniref:thermonuclease family protein n=1 Tax=Bordetella pertussis TaxID=520 RepID=UPI000A41CB6A